MAKGGLKRERMEATCRIAVMTSVTEPAKWVGETLRQAEPPKSVLLAANGVQRARKRRKEKLNARGWFTSEGIAIWKKQWGANNESERLDI